MTNYKQPLEPEGIYHIYNRAHGNEELFKEEENYRFFLQKYRGYLDAVVDTYCYCLLPNHFHFLVKVKGEEELKKFMGLKHKHKPSEGLEPSEGFGMQYSRIVSKQFSHFFNSYTQSFNKVYHRKGGLFMHKFNRKRITDEHYLRNLVYYIHHNPVEAGLCYTLEQWEYSSYTKIIKGDPILENRREVVSWFENIDNFVDFHNNKYNGGKYDSFF